MIPVGVQTISGANWLAVLLVSVATLICIMLCCRFGYRTDNKIVNILKWVVLTAVLCELAKASSESWQEGGHKTVGLILLALAMWSALKGPAAAARVGCALFWFIIVLYPILIGLAVKHIELQWLKPEKVDVKALGLLVLLTPAAAASLKIKQCVNLQQVIPSVVCIAAAVVTGGVLSSEVASSQQHPFYELIRSLPFRAEALLCAAGAGGWFLLLSIYLTQCGRSMPGKQNRMIVLSAAIAAVAVIFGIQIPHWILLILAVIFWVVQPLFAQVLWQIKKVEKSENKA